MDTDDWDLLKRVYAYHHWINIDTFFNDAFADKSEMRLNNKIIKVRLTEPHFAFLLMVAVFEDFMRVNYYKKMEIKYIADRL